MLSKALIAILSADTDKADALAAIVGDRIYPIVDLPEVPEDAALAAIYYNVQMYPESTKLGPVANNHTVTFLTVADGYEKAWEIALKLRDALQLQRGTFKNVEFRLPRPESIEDEYSELVPLSMYGVKEIFKIRTAYY